jgi:hypothetical protein
MHSPTFAEQSLSQARATDIRKIALISHDYNKRDSCGLQDYSEHFYEINRQCDEYGCDTILYALWTWDNRSTVLRTHGSIFNGLSHVRRVILEPGNWPDDDQISPPLDQLHVEVWSSDDAHPRILQQRFAVAGDHSGKWQFISELPSRRISDGLVIICGESQIVSERRMGGFNDYLGFLPQLDQLGTKVILNPIHYFMQPSHGIDIRRKRKLYSTRGRTVVSVWNQGYSRENMKIPPWTVFHNGEDKTHGVQELPTPFHQRPDIRIGVVSIPALLPKH